MMMYRIGVRRIIRYASILVAYVGIPPLMI